ncbi:Aminotran_5 domain-containing protein [Pseudozyma hubeiensis]|nr:Aminotran_5 domain-containing protein [Pseudozyma hubeiensis]
MSTSATLTAAELQRIRAQFPALVSADTPNTAMSGYVFAENAGGSQVLSSVADSITSYLLQTNVQMASYPLASSAERNVSLGTCAAAVLLGAESPDDVMIGQSATALVASVALMIENQGRWGGEDEVVISDADHETNRGAWTRMAKRLGMQLKNWPVETTSKDNAFAVTLNPEALTDIVTPRTKLVAFTACSNLLGAFTDITKAVQIVRSISPDALIVVDCVAFAPHRRVQPRKWGVDIAFFSLYKTYGAHVGAMYIDPRVKTQLKRLNHFFLQPSPGEGEGIKGMYPFQTSSVQYELNHSIAAVADYLVSVGRGKVGEKGEEVDWNGLFERASALPYVTQTKGSDGAVSGERVKMTRAQVEEVLDRAFAKIADHESKLSSLFITALLKYASKGVRIVGPESSSSSERAPTVAFIVIDPTTGKQRVGTSKAIHTALVEGGKMGAQQGHMYAHRLVESLGLDLKDGVVRVSWVHYNTEEEVKRVVGWLDGVVEHVLG